MSKSSSSNNSGKKVSWSQIIGIIVMLVLGILFIIAYAVNRNIVEYLIGAIALIGGIALIVINIISTGKLINAGTIGGILAIAVAIYEFVGGALANVLTEILAWFIFLIGIVLFLVGIVVLCSKGHHIVSGCIQLVLGAVLAVLGGLMLFPTNDPILGSSFIWLITGIVVIILAIYLVLSIFFPSIGYSKVSSKKKVE